MGISEGMGKKVAKGFENEGGKRPSPMSSEEQVVQAVENSSKLLTANIEHDGSSTVNKDVQLEHHWKSGIS